MKPCRTNIPEIGRATTTVIDFVDNYAQQYGAVLTLGILSAIRSYRWSNISRERLREIYEYFDSDDQRIDFLLDGTSHLLFFLADEDRVVLEKQMMRSLLWLHTCDLVDDEIRQRAPRDEDAIALVANPWVIFIYTLSHISLTELSVSESAPVVQGNESVPGLTAKNL
ncbi:hypothetical protein ACLPJK_25945 [Pseudomonas aeruginosa]|uniref:hypothetical protein n=1 Tax=Pseudomonas aeruginosa TaxID=287 RepID=UPI003D2E5469